MSNLFQYFDFPGYPINVHLILYFVFLKNFNSYFLISYGVDCVLDLTKGALTKSAVHDKVTYLLDLLLLLGLSTKYELF